MVVTFGHFLQSFVVERGLVEQLGYQAHYKNNNGYVKQGTELAGEFNKQHRGGKRSSKGSADKSTHAKENSDGGKLRRHTEEK